MRNTLRTFVLVALLTGGALLLWWSPAQPDAVAPPAASAAPVEVPSSAPTQPEPAAAPAVPQSSMAPAEVPEPARTAVAAPPVASADSVLERRLARIERHKRRFELSKRGTPEEALAARRLLEECLLATLDAKGEYVDSQSRSATSPEQDGRLTTVGEGRMYRWSRDEHPLLAELAARSLPEVEQEPKLDPEQRQAVLAACAEALAQVAAARPR